MALMRTTKVNDQDAGTVLIHKMPSRKLDFAKAMRWVQATHGKGPYRQVTEIGRLAVQGWITPTDYYFYSLFDPALSHDERRAFLSDRASYDLNMSLNPLSLRTQNALIADKMFSAFLFDRLGLPTPRMLGHASTLFHFDDPGTLTTPDAVLEFLQTPGNLPCFGKPVHSSRGFGAASYAAISEDGETLTLGDGRAVSARRLVDEIFAFYPDGYVFQEMLQHGDVLAALVGKTAASLRIVTIQDAAGPTALYGVFRLPAKGAMTDGYIAGQTMVAMLDMASGSITRVQSMYRFSGRDEATYPVTGAVLAGVTLADWDESLKLAVKGHWGLAEHGLLGWDMLLTEHGPVVTEVNTNPLHMVYQRAANRGLMNPDLLPAITRAKDFVAARQAARAPTPSASRLGFPRRRA